MSRSKIVLRLGGLDMYCNTNDFITAYCCLSHYQSNASNNNDISRLRDFKAARFCNKPPINIFSSEHIPLVIPLSYSAFSGFLLSHVVAFMGFLCFVPVWFPRLFKVIEFAVVGCRGAKTM